MNHVNHDMASLTFKADAGIDDGMRQELETIQRKKADVERQLKAIEEKRTELEVWLRDLTVTERTLARLLEVDLPETSANTGASHRRKPNNIPSVHEMAVTIIRERAEEFVEGQDIVSAIKRRWWPDATNNDIGPTLWRLATRDNKLRKEGTRYGLPIRVVVRDASTGKFL
jgi:hypothetical protein